MKKYLTFLVSGLLGTMLLAASSASATTLFAGGEDSDFTLAGVVSVSTTAGTFNSGFAREALSVNGSSATLPPSSSITTPTFTASSTFWFHAALNAWAGSQLNTILFAAYSPDGVGRILIRDSSTGGEYKIATGNAAGTITDLVTTSAVCAAGTLNTIDLFINYASSGTVTFYCNGVSIASYSGNLLTDSATQLNKILLGATDLGCCTGNYWSEVIVATTDTRNMRLATLAPSSNGNTDNWDVGGVSNVNEVTDNTSTVNASGTAGEIQEYTVTSLPSGSFQVQDVWLNMKAQVDTTGPQHIQGMVRAGSTDYTSSNLSPPQGSWGWISTDWTTNPNTGVAWTASDLSAVGFNMGFKSAN